MTLADMHVHSEASRRPSEWFLKKVGASECYTDIDTLYRQAKACGMDFVTVTDHNTIEQGLKLVAQYPDDTFLSVEVTTYFPEDRCKIHLLVYDITPQLFDGLMEVRHDIYQLRDFIVEKDLAHSVAHGFYSINKRLTIATLEKLILLFDVFEGLNGARNHYYNMIWQDILNNLTPERLAVLKKKYNISPMSSTPWIKGFTGGSDDHAGLFIGQTTTVSGGGRTLAEFIQSIKEKKTNAAGRCNDYKTFAFSIYKIFCDYSSVARKQVPGGILSFINEVVFEDRQSRLKQWITLRKVKRGKHPKDRIWLKFFEDIQSCRTENAMDIEDRLDGAYQSMGLLLDEFFKMVIDSFVNDFATGDVGKMFRNLMSSLPAFFISVPFFSALKHLSQDREMMFRLKETYCGRQEISQRKILWFTDTLHDLNGVSVTLNQFRQKAVEKDLNLVFVTCAPDNGSAAGLDNVIYLPVICDVAPEFYSSQTLRFPSLLASIEKIHDSHPDRILISTPGPVGIIGQMMAAMLGIESVCIFHTDFAAQAVHIFEDESMVGLVNSVINRFYAFADRIKVPTKAYIGMLESMQYPKEKMSVFKRGVSVSPININRSWKREFKTKKNIPEGFTLMWAGRVSKDKNVEFLMSVFEQASAKIPDLNLLVCGDGPDLHGLKDRYHGNDRVFFFGRVDHQSLESFYDVSDLFVFPSTTDTFGMVILEAQSRGVPVLVTDIGGPRELIAENKTGFVLRLCERRAWVDKIVEIHELKANSPKAFARLRSRCQRHVADRFSWNDALADILVDGETVKGGSTRRDTDSTALIKDLHKGAA